MNDYQLIPVEASLIYTADFSDVLVQGVVVTACEWSISPVSGSPAAPTLAAQSDDFANKQSSIRVSGATHGGRYVLQAKATLNNGEVVVKDIALVGFNG